MQHPPNYGIIIRIHLVFYYPAILYSILRLLTLSVGPFTVLGWDGQSVSPLLHCLLQPSVYSGALFTSAGGGGGGW